MTEQVEHIELKSNHIVYNDLKHQWNSPQLYDNKEYVANLEQIVNMLENKEPVYLQLLDPTHPLNGSVALLSKFVNQPDLESLKRLAGQQRYLTAPAYQVRWEGLKNTAKWKGHGGSRIIWLKGYAGPTTRAERTDYDIINESLEGQRDLYNKFGQKIFIGAECVYINARYGSGAELDQGTVVDIVPRVVRRKNGDIVEHTVTVQRLDGVEKSELKKWSQSILISPTEW